MASSRKRKRRSLDLDLDKGLQIAKRLPGHITKLEALGKTVPPWIGSLAPFVAVGAGFLDNVLEDAFEEEDDDDFFAAAPGATLPDTGPLGAGRREYLRTRKSFADPVIADAWEKISVLPGAGIEAVARQVNLVVDLISNSVKGQPEVTAETVVRRAVDYILQGESLPQPTLDKFGDVLMFGLRQLGPTKKRIPKS